MLGRRTYRRRRLGSTEFEHINDARAMRSAAVDAAGDAQAKMVRGDCAGAYDDVIFATDTMAKINTSLTAAGLTGVPRRDPNAALPRWPEHANNVVVAAVEKFRHACVLKKRKR